MQGVTELLLLVLIILLWGVGFLFTLGFTRATKVPNEFGVYAREKKDLTHYIFEFTTLGLFWPFFLGQELQHYLNKIANSEE